MPAYFISNIRVQDPDVFAEYARQAPASIERYGGRYVVRGGAAEVHEGSWKPDRLVILEFPDADAARRWYDSDEYRAARALRQRAAQTDVVLVEGLA